MKNSTRGFTLIELLVVIAIIGVLSSVVLASLNTARNKGTDAAIKSQMAAIRPQAEIVYDNGGNYGIGQAAANCITSVSTRLFGTTTIKNQVDNVISSAGGTTFTWCATNPTSGNATDWAMVAVLKGTGAGTTAWCVDSTGASKQVTIGANTPAEGTNPNNTGYVCD
jgi:type IV pilus assembly protein PilA